MIISIKEIRNFIISVLIPLIIGYLSNALSSLLSRLSTSTYYSQLIKPSFAPPGYIFPIVWTILFILMAVGAARVWLTPDSKSKAKGLRLYILQLGANFIWSILFFNLQAYALAFFWLIFLWLLILLMIIAFSKSDKTAAYLQIPYLIWVTFAGYLNYAIYLLN